MSEPAIIEESRAATLCRRIPPRLSRLQARRRREVSAEAPKQRTGMLQRHSGRERPVDIGPPPS